MMSDMKPKKIFARALDPIHIGAGGYRLGRVDNTIVRDPATDVPKIPGTSMAGVVRAFTEIIKEEGRLDVNIDEVFGTETKKGILRFYDGQIIFFPVSSIQGTVWITTKELFEYWLEEVKDSDGVKIKIPDEIGNEACAVKGINTVKYLNLGWLLLEVKNVTDGKEIVLPSEIDKWVKKIVVVSDKLFSHIVNDNLEVRTSVRINPETGAAVEGALFTYEAMPRGTVLGFEIGVDNAMAKKRSIDDNIDDNIVNNIITAVSIYIRNLGIGGMGTRGFGRIELMIEERGKSGEGDFNAQS